MKVRILQEIESEVRDQPHQVGKIIERPDAWWLCNILKGGQPVAEPIDDEARAAVQPFLDRQEKIRSQLEKQAAQFREEERRRTEVDQALRHSEFEKHLLEGV